MSAVRDEAKKVAGKMKAVLADRRAVATPGLHAPKRHVAGEVLRKIREARKGSR